MKAPKWMFFLLFAITLCNCVEVVGIGGDPKLGKSQDSLCTTLAKARCTRLNECYPLVLQADFGDQETCVARETLDCEHQSKTPHIGANDADIKNCTTKVLQQSCVLLELRLGRCAFPKGTLAVGQPCAFSTQCKDGYCAYVSSRDKLHTRECKAYATKENPCSLGSSANCPPGQECLLVDRQPRCGIPMYEGEPCSDSSPCSNRLACKNGICIKQAQGGAPCELSDFNACDETGGFYCPNCSDCAPAQRVCTPKTLNEEGERCGSIHDWPPSACKRGFCTNQNDFGSGTCKRYVKEGEACAEYEGPRCMHPAVCHAGKCVLPSIEIYTKK